jgi:hypothetical protein
VDRRIPEALSTSRGKPAGVATATGFRPYRAKAGTLSCASITHLLAFADHAAEFYAGSGTIAGGRSNSRRECRESPDAVRSGRGMRLRQMMVSARETTHARCSGSGQSIAKSEVVYSEGSVSQMMVHTAQRMWVRLTSLPNRLRLS